MSVANLNILQTGMAMTSSSMVKENQFLLLVNGNIQRVSGDFSLITNDHSNLLATRFKDGYKVIGTSIISSLSTTLFFLCNPETQDSEIGFILDVSSPDKPDAVTSEGKIIEDTPLEQTLQNPICVYNTFVNAKCLNFDIDHPVASWVKVDDCNVRIYFNDFKNPPRYIDYKDFPKINLSNCPLIETNQLDCDKILIFPETCYPIIDVVDVISGGQNTAGVYQFAICYSDVNANKITDYYYVTNPIPLFDTPITVNTAYPVYKSFKLNIFNLNTDFKYFNLAVLKTINNVTTPFLVETFEVNSNYFEYIYTGNDKNIQQNLTIDEILAKRPYYNKAKGLTESNGYLFQFNLEENRVLNLQPVVNNIPLFWQNVEMSAGDYANPIIAQNFVGFLGDEVYPFGISFTFTNGKQTNVFPFIGREATSYDLEVIPTTNKDVIFNSSCDTTIRDKRWQVYNTAEELGDSVCIIIPPSGVSTVEITDNRVCLSDSILMNSVQSYNSTTGEIVYTTTPLFWHYPSSDISSIYYIGTNPITGSAYNYPPQNSDDVAALQVFQANPNNIIVGSPAVLATLTCDCATQFGNDYPVGATFTALPINQDPNSNTSSIEVLSDEQFISNNNYYTSTSPYTIIPGSVPANSLYPYQPSPYADAPEWQNWYNTQTNLSFDTSAIIPQSNTPSPALDTWGAFVFDNTDLANYPPRPYYYSFVCSNSDGVAAIMLSHNSGIPSSAIQFNLYASDQTTLLTPVNGSTDASYQFYKDLTVGSIYYIEVQCLVDTTSPDNYIGFRVFAISPKPVETEIFTIPGVVKIAQTCQIKYQGLPENSCKPSPYKYGTFGYWQSQETYPCNEEVWDDLAGKPIRHFKFPDHNIAPYYKTTGFVVNNLSLKSNKIYPKGIVVDINSIKLALENAVTKGLITNKEKDSICGYRIYRGNRRGNQSIVAKGLLYDVWEYKDNVYNTGDKVLFPNFPFNDNRANEIIKTKQVKNINLAEDSNFLLHPFSDTLVNNKYTFDSPNTSFNNPGLGTELKLECEQIGKTVGNYIELKNNAKYQYIGAGIISAAIGFASVEAAFEALNTMVNATLTITVQIFGSGTQIPLGLILAAVGENILAPFRVYSHYAEWYDIIKKFAPYRNYGIYYTGVGKYIDYTDIVNSNVKETNIRRTIANTQYIKPGILNVKTTKGATRFNNFKRDSSVFIELDNNSTFLPTYSTDTSRQLPSCNSTGVTGDLSSYYASLKNLNISQYGQIDNIEWIDTGYNGRIDWNNPQQDTLCDTIFGGDTYITTFTKKRKNPIFLEDRVIPSSSTNVNLLNQDIQLSLLPNIGYPRYFMDYPNTLDYTGTSQALFGDVAVLNNNRADYNFLCFSSSGQSWKDAGLGAAIVGGLSGAAFGVISLPITIAAISVSVKRDLGNDLFLNGKYIHSYYGISSFLCESDYNLDLRHGENNKEKNFYPNVGDINEWTQEYYIPMSEDNFYNYNNDYSKQNKENPNFVLNNDFSQVKSDCKIQHPNLLIYSLQDNDQNDEFDGNLIYLANNKYNFPKSAGRLQIVKGLSNGKVLVIQEDGYSVFNSYISQESNIGISTVGSNSIFNGSIPAQSIKTDLGIGGSQTAAIAVTEFGAFWADNKRGQLIQFQDSFKNIVKADEEWWFKENLPFHILEDFPDFDVTNNYKYVGMTITYDARYKRVFFSKRDVELKPEYKNAGITYDGTVFHFGEETFTVESTKYFCNKSWNISYSPLLQSFVSLHTWFPNYTTPNQNYFSSGVNYPIGKLQDGSSFWHHNLTNKSYQVYYGELEPFIFEFSVPTKYQNNQLQSIRYEADFYRFQDNLSAGLLPNLTYNKAIVYNQKQSSGLLELTLKEKNNRQQFLQFPKQNINSRSILVESVERGFQFNNFHDVSVENSGQPLFSFQCDNIAYKEINPLSLSYKPQYLAKKMMSDYHVIRLINDKYSNYNINHRFITSETQTINN